MCPIAPFSDHDSIKLPVLDSNCIYDFTLTQDVVVAEDITHSYCEI